MNSFRKMKLKLSKPEKKECIKNKIIAKSGEKRLTNLTDYDVTTSPPSCNSPSKRLCKNKVSEEVEELKPQQLFFKESSINHPDNIQIQFISSVASDEEIAPPNEDDRKTVIFQCKFCERSFSYLCHLKVHERVHTGEKPYACKYCSTPFSQLGSLTVHMRIHTGVKPYHCDVCSKKFRHINSLRRHQKQVHAGQTISPVREVIGDEEIDKERHLSIKTPYNSSSLARQFHFDNRSFATNLTDTNYTKQMGLKQKSIFTSIDKIIGDNDDSRKSMHTKFLNENYLNLSQTCQNLFTVKDHFQSHSDFMPNYVSYFQNVLLQYFPKKNSDEGYSCPSVEMSKFPIKPKQMINPKYIPHKNVTLSDCINRKWSEDSGIY